MTQQEARAAPDVIMGTLSIFNQDAYILIDPGATHSFISHSFSKYADRNLTALDGEMGITIPTGNIIYVSQVFRNCVVKVGDQILEADRGRFNSSRYL
jgi:hypothetical protein